MEENNKSIIILELYRGGSLGKYTYNIDNKSIYYEGRFSRYNYDPISDFSDDFKNGSLILAHKLDLITDNLLLVLIK